MTVGRSCQGNFSGGSEVVARTCFVGPRLFAHFNCRLPIEPREIGNQSLLVLGNAADLQNRSALRTWPKQKQIQAKRHPHGFGGLRPDRPVNGVQKILNGGSVEIGGGRDATLLGEGEVAREGFNRSRDAVAAFAANFNQVIGRGDGNQKASVGAQDALEFWRIHPARNRKDGRKRVVGVGDYAIGVGHHPLAFGVASCSNFDRGN